MSTTPTAGQGTKKKLRGQALLVHSLQQVFQCGDLKDVSNYVATSAHQTAIQTKRSKNNSISPKQRESEEGRILRSTDTATTHSHSSSSSFVIPSRQSLEELVRKKKVSGSKSSGILSYCGAFDCASRDTTFDDEDDNVAVNKNVVEEDQDVASIFSRTAATKQPPQEGDQPYHFTIKVAPPRSEYTYRTNKDYELRSVVSDCTSSARTVSTAASLRS